jgi:general stress protein 26
MRIVEDRLAGQTHRKEAPMTDHERCWEAMTELRTCLLVTVTARGPHARPMNAIVRPEESAVWFLTDSGSEKTAELETAPDVCLIFTDGSSRHLVVSGHATLTNDRDAVRSIWTPEAKAFWPNGPDDPSVNAIHVQPIDAEMWEGDNFAVAAVKAAFAAIKGVRADLGTHAKVAL